MKKHILSILAFICAAVSLVVSLLDSSPIPKEPIDYSVELQELADKNAELQAQIDALAVQLEGAAMRTGLADWSLSVEPWESGEGASVTLTAAPANYQEGMSAQFSIRLDGQEVVNVPCSLEGEVFIAASDVAAADGYSYYCILLDADGSKQQFALSTPENPVEDIPVYLQTSLSAYCNMMVDSWLDTEDSITITAGYVQVQLPRLTVNNDLSIEKAQLVLEFNGEEIDRQDITLEAGEGHQCFETVLTDTTFTLPEMIDDDYLDLRLEVSLAGGDVLTSSGASWYKTPDGLFLVVG